ncbi:MAG: polysaccharide deacetylase family protein [Longimicrobiales bacterium]
MLHRFSDPDLGVTGHDPELLRKSLDLLRRKNVPLLSLEEVVAGVRRGAVGRGVAFTVDDGYSDFDRVGAEIFQEFDCPVTVFPCTGFIDGLFWFWWDRLAFAFLNTERDRISAPELDLTLNLETRAGTAISLSLATERIKTLPDGDRKGWVDYILEELDVEIPTRPPSRYRPMTWGRIRALASELISFGPHTVHHSSLATAGPAQVHEEISGSYRRLKEEIREPLSVFCYPYGTAADVSTEAGSIIESLGLRGAVTAIPRYVSAGGADGTDPFLMGRFPWPSNLVDLRQVAFGFQRLKDLLRSGGKAG